MKDGKGKPTRRALSAKAWGEPVPSTASDVKKLAKKGTELLEKYHEAADKKPATAKKTKPRAATASTKTTTAKKASAKKTTTKKKQS